MKIPTKTYVYIIREMKGFKIQKILEDGFNNCLLIFFLKFLNPQDLQINNFIFFYGTDN